jgi:hypothetical protein
VFPEKNLIPRHSETFLCYPVNCTYRDSCRVIIRHTMSLFPSQCNTIYILSFSSLPLSQHVSALLGHLQVLITILCCIETETMTLYVTWCKRMLKYKLVIIRQIILFKISQLQRIRSLPCNISK